ncbi:hypothetical protein Nepgr_010412 [Nepenthes gracilis]|uniref:Glucan endo-1,3-beta-D-glucosidase n=1 Tax=Nepenthes gracilis TaxID=150966 RepID=A0AAD3SCN2_NEPGR|nr:hypothetical protein Nepgr_010412 [Nepenthes gracilis]
MAAAVLILGLLLVAGGEITDAGAESVGVCYGMQGNNLPPPSQVVSLYKSHNIKRMRLYDPNQAALQALKGTDIQLILGVPNTGLRNLATNPSAAHSWVQNNVKNHWPDVKFRYITVGNEVSPVGSSTAQLAQFVLPAMTNIHNAIASAGLGNQIRVSTAIDMTLIGNSYPPSNGQFRGDVRSYLDPIIAFLVRNGAPLLANIYPYFSYAGSPKDISLPYALFTAPKVVVWDGPHGYQCLFDAMLDSLYSALERAGGAGLGVVVSESGWPTAGGVGTTVENARTYVSKLTQHVKGGTPKRPGKAIETYVFAMFDENNKEPELEKHWGVFNPNKQPKYPIDFDGERVWKVLAGHNVSGSLASAM